MKEGKIMPLAGSYKFYSDLEAMVKGFAEWAGKGSKDEWVKDYFESLTDHSASGLLGIVHNRVTYTQDPSFLFFKEYWREARETLEEERGDCEDFTIALGALYLIEGYAVKFLVVGDTKDKADHATLQVKSSQGWIEADGTIGILGAVPLSRHVFAEYIIDGKTSEYLPIDDSDDIIYEFKDLNLKDLTWIIAGIILTVLVLLVLLPYGYKNKREIV